MQQWQNVSMMTQLSRGLTVLPQPSTAPPTTTVKSSLIHVELIALISKWVVRRLSCHPRWPMAMWQTTEHVAFRWPLTRKNLSPISSPWLTCCDKRMARNPVTTDHWDSFVRAVNRITRGHAGVRAETGELWPPPSTTGCGWWYFVRRSIDKIGNRRWIVDKIGWTV